MIPEKSLFAPHLITEYPMTAGKRWSVDLFGPLPSKNHVVVVQDLSSRYPAAKIVSNTSAKAVLPVLKDTYDTFGNPQIQKSDNGPPFNSKQMADFTTTRGIEQVKTAPGHPGPNNAETVMKPLGKAMKIGHANQVSEKETLSSFLVGYRDTPHASTGVSPGSMLLRDGYRTQFPQSKLSDSAVVDARSRDRATKDARKVRFNSARHTKESCIQQGDHVLVKNFRKTSKFQPYYLSDLYLVTDIRDGNIFILQNIENGSYLKRHPDDLKIFQGDASQCDEPRADISEADTTAAWRDVFNDIDRYGYGDFEEDVVAVCGETVELPPVQEVLRRSARHRTPNTQVFNQDYDTS